MDTDFSLFDDAMMMGAGYGLYRHGQDAQTERIVAALRDDDAALTNDDSFTYPPPEPAPPINAIEHSTALQPPEEWDEYIGQEPMKQQLMVTIASAMIRHSRLPHILLASGMPGVGKTTMARLIARTIKKNIVELVPPFNVDSLVTAAQGLEDGDVLFIDEIHKLTDGVGARGAEVLLKILEDGVAYVNGVAVRLPDITIIGATTDPDKLPEPVIDRFKVKPYFQKYSTIELCQIAIQFAYRHRSEEYVTNQLGSAIADACRGTPRIIEEMVMACRDLALVNNNQPTSPATMLAFLEVEPDGLTRTHIHYLTALRQYFGRVNKDDQVEYIVGEAAMQQILRETKPGIGRVERFLVERGLIDRTPRGRRLTPLGIARAEQFIQLGKGVSDVA